MADSRTKRSGRWHTGDVILTVEGSKPVIDFSELVEYSAAALARKTPNAKRPVSRSVAASNKPSEPAVTMVGKMKVSKPATVQGGWNDLELFEVDRHTSEILDELRADSK